MTRNEILAKARADRPPLVHLYRGSPCVRGWSRHKSTDKRKTLCGVPIKYPKGSDVSITAASDDPSLVNCPYCTELMHPGDCNASQAKCSFCEVLP